MAFPKNPTRRREAWWRCGDQSPLSCGESSVDAAVEGGQPSESVSHSSLHAAAMRFGGAPGASYAIQGVRSLVHGVVSPFMNCVTPPMSMCLSQQQDFASWQHQEDSYPVSRRGEFFIYMPASTDSQQSSHKAVLRSPSLPLNNIETCHVHCNDILCGRGTHSTTPHVGNRNFRELIAANRDAYAGLTRKQKLAFARSIVDLVHSTRPAGRFLMRDSTTGLWNDIGMARSIEKTTQALREGGNPASEASSVPPEERSVAPTGVSESLASESTTPASNNSQRSTRRQQVNVPMHLRHVFSSAPERIPTIVHPISPIPYQDATQAVALGATATPVTPDSPNRTHRFTVAPSFSDRNLDQLVHLGKATDSITVSPASVPSAPPAIWRIRNSSISALPDIRRSDSMMPTSKSSEDDRLGPSIEKIASDGSTDMKTSRLGNSSSGVHDSSESDGTTIPIQSTLSMDERVVGRERSESITSMPSSGLPLPPSSVSRHRRRAYQVALTTTGFLGLDKASNEP